jgi:hypothetical protein
MRDARKRMDEIEASLKGKVVWPGKKHEAILKSQHAARASDVGNLEGAFDKYAAGHPDASENTVRSNMGRNREVVDQQSVIQRDDSWN